MIRTLICVALCFALLGCDQDDRDENGAYVAGDDMSRFGWSVVDVKAEGHTHQYLVWWPGTHRSGITHLPDCKYCKGDGRR